MRRPSRKLVAVEVEPQKPEERYRCACCWKTFAESELRVVHEITGMGFRCRSCPDDLADYGEKKIVVEV